WVRRSGGGLHVGFELREPVEADDSGYFRQACGLYKRLVAALSGDPAVAHPAVLLRMEGTHNSKRGAPIRVETLWGTGKPVDLSEVEALIELLPAEDMFERKAASNGHDKRPSAFSAHRVDAEAALAGMEPNGGSVNSI